MTRDVTASTGPLSKEVSRKSDTSVRATEKGLPPSRPPSCSLLELHAMGSFQALFQSQDIDALEASSSSSTSSTTTSNLRKRNSSNALQLLDESTNLPQDTSEVNGVAETTDDPLHGKPVEEETSIKATQTILKSEGKKSRPNSPQRNVQSETQSPKKIDQVTDTTATCTSTASNTIIRHPNSITASQPPPLLLLPSPDGGNHMDPDEFLLQLVTALYPQVKLQVKPALELANSSSYFPTITEEQMARYNTHVVALVRTNDVAALQEYHATHGPHALDCCNRFGEGLLNMACRRGFTEMVAFLLSSSVDLSVRVRDDFGRTPLHDACWHPEPQLDICRWIMQKDPSLFLVADKRGYTPFQYAR